MIGFNRVRTTIVLGLSVLIATSILGVGSLFAQTVTVTGKVTLKQADGTEVPATSTMITSNQVVINGTNAISGATVFSDSTVTTAKGSSAVVSLGKLGRVEIFPSSSVNLDFDNDSIKVKLEAGRVRVSSSSGVSATAATRDGEVVANSAQENTFTVDVVCGNTIVSTQTGSVELRAGGTVKQIATGSQDSAGTAKPSRCKGGKP